MDFEEYSLPLAPNGRFTIELAKSMSERYKALQFRHEVYLEKGLNSKEESAPVSKYHIENEWFIATAKLDNTIVGTVSFFVGNHHMMPANELIDLSFYGDKHLCEFSGMAVHRNYQRSHAIFLPLAKYCLDFAANCLKVSAALAVVHPKQVPFYCNILNFKLASEQTFTYESVNNALAQVITIDMSNYYQTLHVRMNNEEKYQKIGAYLTTSDPTIWMYPNVTT